MACLLLAAASSNWGLLFGFQESGGAVYQKHADIVARFAGRVKRYADDANENHHVNQNKADDTDDC